VRRKKAHRLFKDELFRKTINYLWTKEAQAEGQPPEQPSPAQSPELPPEQPSPAQSPEPPTAVEVKVEGAPPQQEADNKDLAPSEGAAQIADTGKEIVTPEVPTPEVAGPEIQIPEPVAPETTVPEVSQEQIGHNLVRGLEDTLGSLEQMVPRAARLERLLAKREYDTIMKEFPDYGKAFSFFYRNDLLKYDPAKVHMIMLDPSMQNEAKKSTQTLLRYHFVMKAMREARARGLTDLGSLPRDTVVRMMSSEFDDLYAKAFGDKPLTDNDYVSILRSLQSAGFRVSGLPVQRTTATPTVTPQPAVAPSGGLKAFISSLGPLSLVSLLVGVPLGLAGLVQLLFAKEDSGIGPYLTTGAGAVLSALGLMNVDRMVGLTR
jgi:hypothetical protein